MPLKHTQAHLTLYRNGQARFNDLARRHLLGKTAVTLSAPTAIGGRWLVLPVEQGEAGALKLTDDRGHKRFNAYPLAIALFAWLPPDQKSLNLLLEPAPAGFWLRPAESGLIHHKNESLAQAA